VPRSWTPGPLGGEKEFSVKVKWTLAIVGIALTLLNVAGIVTGGCASTTVPPKLTAEQREAVAQEHLDVIVGVERFRPSVYSDALVRALRETDLFSGVEHLDDLVETPDLIASVKKGISGTAAIPFLTGITAGIVPTTVEETHGHIFDIRSPRAPAESVMVEFTYRGPTTLGLASMFLNLSPTRACCDVRQSRQFYDALAYDIVSRAPAIRELMKHGAGHDSGSPAN
jgi:hypothetical protein